MILSEEAAKARLGSPNNLANRFGRPVPSESVVPEAAETPNEYSEMAPSSDPRSAVTIEKMTRPGNPGYRLPVEVKNVIATLSRSGVPQKELAEAFDTTQAEVSQIERGKVKSVDESIVEKKLFSVRESALDRLTQAVLGITDDKMSNVKATDLSNIAKNLAFVVERTAPRQDLPGGSAAQIIIYAPSLRDENSYKVVEVSGAS